MVGVPMAVLAAAASVAFSTDLPTLVLSLMSVATWVCASGVRESESRASFPMQTVVDVEPVGMRAMSKDPLVTSAAAWTWASGVRASDSRESFPMQTVDDVVPVGIRAMLNVPDVTSPAA
jgi:hypothetical protein